MDVLGVVLAAGRSRRFGDADKMAARLDGAGAVLTQSATALAASGMTGCLAVLRGAGQAALLPDGFQWVICQGEMADSLRCAVEAAQRMKSDKLLIALGDMPFVTPCLLGKIIAAADLAQPGFVLGDDGPSVPACFPAVWYDRLAGLRGDQGARGLLHGLPAGGVTVGPGELRDIDRPGDLDAQAPSQPLP